MMGGFYDRLILCSLIKVLTHMIAVYIIVPDIIIKFIRGTLYLRRGPFPFKLIYAQIVKDLLYNLIIFNKGDYFHLFPAPGTNKRVHFIYLLYKPCPGPVQTPGAIVFYNMILVPTIFFFQPAPCNIAVVAQISNGLPTSVRYMGDKSCHPFKATELLYILSVFGLIYYLFLNRIIYLFHNKALRIHQLLLLYRFHYT